MPPSALKNRYAETKLLLKEFAYPLLTVIAVFIIFKISSKFNFKAGLMLLFVILLILFIKKTKFLFYMFIISLPFTDIWWIFRMDFQFQLNYLFFILLLISFFYDKFRNNDYSFNITCIDKPLFLFLFAATISVFQTIYLRDDPIIIYDSFRSYPWIKGFVGILFLIFMFLVYYLTANIAKDEETFKKTIIFFMLTSAIICLYALVGIFFSFPEQISPVIGPSLRIKSVFREPLFFGNYLLTIIPVIYCLLISKIEYINRSFLVITSFILTLALGLTMSRGAWFGYMVFLLLFTIIYWKRLDRLFKTALKASFFILLLFVVLLTVGPLVLNARGNDTVTTIKTGTEHLIEPIIGIVDPSIGAFWSTRIRFLSIKYAFDGFTQHPILGIGYSNYLFYTGFKVYGGLFASPMNFPEVNNFPIKILAEMGIIGFIVFAWLVIKIFKSAISMIVNEKEKTKKTLLTGYFLSVIAVSVQLLFFSYITLAYLWVMLAMMMSLCRTKTINLRSAKGNQDDNRH